jgi:acyl-CoA synthetase (AMP-forming)/AMP-acid ligase II
VSASRDHNVASLLERSAERAPERAAVIEPGSKHGPGKGWKRFSFAELHHRTARIAHGLAARGLAPGDRAALFVRPGVDLVAVTFALFKLGAVPVILDPGMGVSALVACLARVKPRAFIGVPAAHLVRMLHARELASIEIRVTVGPSWLAGATTLADLCRAHGELASCALREGDTAAVLFTSGSTGPPKGVVYTHANFAAQVRALREVYGLAPGEIDLACFPLFALFSAALEMTAVFPRIDPSRPGKCDPSEVVAALLEHGATNTFGSPAIWRRVVPWCIERGIHLPTLRRALVAGASVPLDLVEGFHRVLGVGADVHTPYGATECLPVSTISGRELAGELRARSESGAGTCVGRAAPDVEIALIAIGDDAIASWREDLRVAAGSLGEICVRGGVVTREYERDAGATALAKIRDGESVWHRTGDVGYFDERGLLWFCGRKSHRIETDRGLVMPVPAENVLNLHPRVAHTALVGVGPRGRERAALVVAPRTMPRGAAARAEFASELNQLLRARGRWTRDLIGPRIETVLYRRALPTDVRHNAKIQREKLKLWAEERVP